VLVTIGNWACCDGTREGGVGTSRLRFRVARKLQTAEIFRAPTVNIFQRGNTKTTLTFEVVRTFPDQKSADLYALQHETLVPITGLITFTSFATNGQKTIRYLNPGFVESHELVEQIGVTTRHQYQIIGGAVTATMPGS
jgi:hypothetical protein